MDDLVTRLLRGEVAALDWADDEIERLTTHRDILAAEVTRLGEALRDAVDAVSSGQRDIIGRHEVYTAQVDVISVERWRDVLPPSETRESDAAA